MEKGGHIASDASKRDALPAHAARLWVWGETFVLIPLHAFWILTRSTPFVAENTTSALIAALPLAVLALTSLAMQLPHARAAVQRAERLFHLTASAGFLILLAYLVVRDPFNPALPITWPLVFWSVCLGFALLANLMSHERLRRAPSSEARPRWMQGIALAAGAWAALAWLASGMSWAPYFWTVSLVFHAGMAVQSRRAPVVAEKLGREPGSAAALVEAWFIAALMLAAFFRQLFLCEMAGRAELKYAGFVSIAANPLFVFGCAVALLAGRFRLVFITHGCVAALLLFTAAETGWPVALVLGYGSAALYGASTRQGPLTWTLSLPSVVLMWGFGLTGFMMAGLVVKYGMGLELAQRFRALAALMPVLYGAWLILWGTMSWRGGGDAGSGDIPAVPSSNDKNGGFWAYAGAWAVMLVITAVLGFAAMWPPVFFGRLARIEVGEATGVCHAGYSRSDEEYARLHALGVRLMRVDFHWSTVQKDPDTWDFSQFDSYLDAAEKHGIKVVALLVFDNNAVETDEIGAKRRNYIAPRDVPLFLEYIRRTVTRYQARVYAWELWNEPDLARFWDGPRDEMYDLIRKSAQTVRETCPGALLLGPAMAGAFGVYSAPGIEGLHAAGALELVGHPTLHVYVSEPRCYYNEFFRVRNAAAKYGHPGKLWITELGDPDGGVYPWRGSREHLAAHAIKAYTIATRVGIEKLLWYCYRDAKPELLQKEPWDSEGFFGLVHHDGSWKPAACAYSLFAHHCSHSEMRADRVQVRGGLGARQLRTALYRREDGDSALVMWFEPGLRPGAQARVSIDLGDLERPALVHSITSGDIHPLLDDVIDVTETPTFLTFKAAELESPVRLRVAESPADAGWLLLALGLVAASACRVIGAKPAGRI
ncbi:MAG TPA: hypothetical protein PLD73_09760 [Candidatus Hydrogenedentes bacterium]|jgi:hypothetical protein|nr:hypothetical protein [Candidatus Hydrogenedentota bacterium]HPJ97915.1 hypothetical protein [Candidatus Hydrogenedentota bacterium]